MKTSNIQRVENRGYLPACLYLLILLFFQENVILGSDYPFPLGEHHPGKLIEEVYKDNPELRVRLIIILLQCDKNGDFLLALVTHLC